MTKENVYYLNVKIFNMSPPLWLRETFNERKKIRTNLKNYSDIQKKKSDDNVAPEVYAELQITISENGKLKSENSSLKSEVSILKRENENLAAAMRTNKEQFENDFGKLQDEIKLNENNLIDNNKKCLLQQKKFLQEVRRLHSYTIKTKQVLMTRSFGIFYRFCLTTNTFYIGIPCECLECFHKRNISK